MRVNTANRHTSYTDTSLNATVNKFQSGNLVEQQNDFGPWIEDEGDIFSWSGEEHPLHFGAFAAQDTAADGASDAQRESPEDHSGTLTRRLVAANNTFIIHRIIGDAFKNLGELRLALAMSDGEDADEKRQIIRRLERVIRRSNRKIRELNNESRLRQNRDRAEREEQLKRAREIEDELRREIIRRRNRERRYIEELEQEEMQRGVQAMLDATTEAAIAAKAQALAAMQVAAQSMGGFGGSDMSGGMPFSAGAFEGGSADGGGAEGAVSGELDVSV
ncbi:MAG: hypothetical protein FWC20_12660 [Oscillospiraceae bacterium]|nr:hypothetical protein [Oscillospiraceae bacterium]MCL2280237.1 hypothetical protein [Oscillospiraceae bacterium]